VIRLALLTLLLATQATAEGFPAQYTVSGVANDDRLNIRSAPDATAEIIGSYGPYALNIEVLRTTPDGKWGFVGMGEQNGWTAMRFLAPSDHQDPNTFPRPLSCSGTEPFWSLNVTVRGDEYHAMGDTRRDLELRSERTAPNGAIATFTEGPSLERTLIVQKGYCSDGMSDREFGWRATLYNDVPDGSSVQTGCCTGDTNYCRSNRLT